MRARVRERPHRKRLGEELLAKLAGPTDLAERGVQDRDTVAESLGLIEAVGGEEDRDATRAKLIDQFVDVAGTAIGTFYLSNR
jgi:hypothetical protein